MMKAILSRIHSDKETLGILDVAEDDKVIASCVTLELPWKDNQHDVSCIPIGEYDVEKCVTPEHGEHFRILNVPDRLNCMIHEGNFLKNTLGCILVGKAEAFLDNNDLKDITSSKPTLAMLYKLLPGTFKLKIQWA